MIHATIAGGSTFAPISNHWLLVARLSAAMVDTQRSWYRMGPRSARRRTLRLGAEGGGLEASMLRLFLLRMMRQELLHPFRWHVPHLGEVFDPLQRGGMSQHRSRDLSPLDWGQVDPANF